MSLSNFLKETLEARKIFGKIELKIIEKQLKGINLTQSEKNRLSRDIRPKFKFIKECARFSDYFEIKKGTETKEIIEDAKKTIINDILFPKIKRIILYGSFVDNKFTYKSDIDVAVEFDNMNVGEATLFRKRIQGKISEKVDVQVYNVLPIKLKKEIDSKGRSIYDKNN